MYGNLALLEDSGKFESGKRVYLTELKGKDEAWLRDTLFDYPEIIPITEIDPTFGPATFLRSLLSIGLPSIHHRLHSQRQPNSLRCALRPSITPPPAWIWRLAIYFW